jgi:hypothetical protein
MHPAALPRAPITRRIAAFRPSWASEISSFTPRSPGRNKLIKKLAQNAVDVVGACHEDLPEVDPVLAEFGDVEDIVGSVSIGVEEAVRAEAVWRYGG